MTPALIDKAAAELMEELLDSTRKEGGEPWFHIIRRKLKRIAGVRCWSCGRRVISVDDNLCRGCGRIVCVSCANLYDHFGNGRHGHA